jgi:hypothetical protein
MRTVIVSPDCGTNYRSEGAEDKLSEREDADSPVDPTDSDGTSDSADR